VALVARNGKLACQFDRSGQNFAMNDSFTVPLHFAGDFAAANPSANSPANLEQVPDFCRTLCFIFAAEDNTSNTKWRTSK